MKECGKVVKKLYKSYFKKILKKVRVVGVCFTSANTPFS